MIDDRIRRARAAEACFRRFNGKPLIIGKNDCVKLATHALIKMGHGSGPVKGLRYANLNQGVRALKRAGFSTVMEGLDAMGLPRIAPAMAMQGDIFALETNPEVENPFGPALAVAMPNGRFLGFIDDSVCQTAIATRYIAAWRL
ncbi:DUF6950 family protein [Brevundimonas sp. FT23028]|uniref:DUF6950 family protein n=1 Tax=Brevundimonas sp. FT23028 TaxID=3393748 RepID=UPI003B589627